MKAKFVSGSGISEAVEQDLIDRGAVFDAGGVEGKY
jgi:hypothetical protein